MYFQSKIEVKLFVFIAGSLGSVILWLFIAIISVKKRIISLFMSSVILILSELIYWTISPMIGYGDAYLTYKCLGITDYSLFSIVFLSIGVIIEHILHVCSLEICVDTSASEMNVNSGQCSHE